ncbi:MAG: hypothetical protein FD121_1253 [Gallionellaceae bacterium]|nr:MAG: hypothetical protein FD121_1253 [Gallionellaceae bacterium]
MKLSITKCTHRDSGACFYLRERAANKNGSLARSVYLRRSVQKGLGHASATRAFAASDAFRVLARSTQVLRLFWSPNKNGSLARTVLFKLGAQKRTRTSTPCGTRT